MVAAYLQFLDTVQEVRERIEPFPPNLALERKATLRVYLTIMKKFLLLIAVCGFLLAGCRTAQPATKWEYRMSSSLSEVNQLSDQGWTVVNFAMPDAGPWQYLLKRAKQ